MVFNENLNDRASWTEGRQTGQTDGWTNRRTDGQIPPVFYRTSSPSGPLPCSLSTLITSYSSRARVPLTTYCLWAAIFHCVRKDKRPLCVGWTIATLGAGFATPFGANVEASGVTVESDAPCGNTAESATVSRAETSGATIPVTPDSLADLRAAAVFLFFLLLGMVAKGEGTVL